MFENFSTQKAIGVEYVDGRTHVVNGKCCNVPLYVCVSVALSARAQHVLRAHCPCHTQQLYQFIQSHSYTRVHMVHMAQENVCFRQHTRAVDDWFGGLKTANSISRVFVTVSIVIAWKLTRFAYAIEIRFSECIQHTKRGLYKFQVLIVPNLTVGWLLSTIRLCFIKQIYNQIFNASFAQLCCSLGHWRETMWRWCTIYILFNCLEFHFSVSAHSLSVIYFCFFVVACSCCWMNVLVAPNELLELTPKPKPKTNSQIIYTM